ncbi:hypothetical protein QJS10_CPB17g00948 [Acorus calamus]|uniref:Uncharacterized protein n=1 Tax=Acorus calamus TaxID=4465 RepID=A0AAV9CVD6_ACOCL|nr:hypothetical protein QJS10_CPB17g00948 [Acorus calamus]
MATGKELLVLTFCFTILVNFKVGDYTDGENSLNPDVGPGIMLKDYPSDLELPSKSVCAEEVESVIYFFICFIE